VDGERTGDAGVERDSSIGGSAPPLAEDDTVPPKEVDIGVPDDTTTLRIEGPLLAPSAAPLPAAPARAVDALFLPVVACACLLSLLLLRAGRGELLRRALLPLTAASNGGGGSSRGARSAPLYHSSTGPISSAAYGVSSALALSGGGGGSGSGGADAGGATATTAATMRRQRAGGGASGGGGGSGGNVSADAASLGGWLLQLNSARGPAAAATAPSDAASGARSPGGSDTGRGRAGGASTSAGRLPDEEDDDEDDDDYVGFRAHRPAETGPLLPLRGAVT
jgi:hypothetical protein